MKKSTNCKKVMAKIINMILENTGSTTQMLEAFTNSKITVEVKSQESFYTPLEFDEFEWDELIIKRETVLFANEIALSKNIVFYDPKLISQIIIDKLDGGDIPLGKLLKDIDYRREILFKDYCMLHEMNKYQVFFDNMKEVQPVKKYKIIKNNKCLFLLYEVFIEENLLTFL
ncbi:chorismate pyruvate-lyase family protein [Clostridium tagluense]|uniref:chorismate pyruvate-lyase family protein n=1 Tax=Clostridium tagluense TaxID=360422 RepID=UPI001CF2CE81|nr:chorismate pyruvate-lyase family protein [Clostridium tagluense]MCB2312719.1 chorismate pyruvate-lyase family protein [Clostridium tagluense]MCB2317486.1 chorismate pyruvate-lyase family protein [Clostridium tagluense]MCB2322282.1 chorismate pyruvate-lyase family protein [Clostridium tagluense]MCB2327287.1 chorismate pyruvate-lyase family protein [Clostridium tagluense]MCB2331987.1 chorismate pyruvate-lyase family protein [Clostridium tagluense]